MKIAFNWPLSIPTSGPGFFMHRLAKELARIRTQIVDNPLEADLYIVFISEDIKNIRFLQERGIKVVQRLDNIYCDSGNTLGDSKTLNQPILETYQNANGVIFQSNFSKKLIENHFGQAKMHAVIHNGIELPKQKASGTKTIFCSSSWRRHKRLKEILEIFNRLDPEFKLVVIGKPDVVLPERVSNIAAKSFEEAIPHYLSASIFLHLCWLDSCPNSVVEALSIGLPVVCGNLGGTPELVRMTNGGLIANTDADFDFSQVDLYHPPPISDVEKIVNFIEKEEYSEVNTEPLRIERCASLYMDFFKQVLASR